MSVFLVSLTHRLGSKPINTNQPTHHTTPHPHATQAAASSSTGAKKKATAPAARGGRGETKAAKAKGGKPKAKKRGAYWDESDEEEDAVCAGEAIRALFGLLPVECLEQIALAASELGLVDDDALVLLCQPSSTRLVLVGSFTERGLARSVRSGISFKCMIVPNYCVCPTSCSHRIVCIINFSILHLVQSHVPTSASSRRLGLRA